MAERQAALVICPGRGTYGKAELGYLHRLHGDKTDLMATVDRLRSQRGQPTITELDGAERFSPALHTRGDIASPLIFTSSYADFLAIDRSRFEIIAATGNSMGWYSTLAVAGAAVDRRRRRQHGAAQTRRLPPVVADYGDQHLTPGLAGLAVLAHRVDDREAVLEVDRAGDGERAVPAHRIAGHRDDVEARPVDGEEIGVGRGEDQRRGDVAARVQGRAEALGPVEL